MTHVKQTSQQSAKQSNQQSDKPLSNVPKLSASALTGSHIEPHSRQGGLSAEKLVQLMRIERQDRQEAQSKAYRRHVAQPSATTVQMSVRMNEDVYRRFRALCKLERRTNGEMLHDLIEVYLDGG
jgi:hypothetical protein